MSTCTHFFALPFVTLKEATGSPSDGALEASKLFSFPVPVAVQNDPEAY